MRTSRVIVARIRSCRNWGGFPVHVWEHDDPVSAAAEIYEIWRERTGASAGQTYDVGDL